jgi:hypothetical protein
MAGVLINPQVQVKWGDLNLSAYDLGTGVKQPIVFNTKVDLPGTSWPSGSFSWEPTGPAFEVYEQCIKDKINDEIQIRFYYVDGPFVVFKFQYNGSSINYGTEMSIEVLLTTAQGPKSSAVRATALKDYTQGKFNSKGQDLYKSAQDIEKAFGKPVPLLWQETAKLDAQKIFLASWQYKDQTYGAEIQNIATQAGMKIATTNIASDGKAAIFTPFTKEGKENKDTVEFPPKAGGQIKAEQRYGFLIGPGIITSFQRSMEYPSQTKGQDATTQPTGTPNKGAPPNSPGSQPLKAKEDQAKAQKDAEKKSVANPSSPTVVKGKKYLKNDEGPENQQLMQQEEGIKFQAQFFMCPALVGIKPQDIIYIPSLRIGDALIEDYKIQSVSYAQDGAIVGVNVQATRTAGLNKPMNEAAAKKFIQKADTLKTTEDWTNYAWKERLGS